MTITSRQYADESDYARIRSLLVESYRISGPPDFATIGDLDWWRFTDNDPNSILAARLWIEDSGDVVAVAWPNGDQVDLLTHPHFRELEDEMLAWAENMQRTPSTNDTVVKLDVPAFSKDDQRRAVLTARGYAKGDAVLNYRTRSLDAIPEKRVADGYFVRHVNGEADLERRVAVHVDAFAPSKMTVEKHRRVMSSPTYRNDLDIVAVAPDGSFAAFCIVWYDDANRNGVFEPVGCHTEHRQRGLASAVMCEGMRRVKALDARSVCVLSHGGEVSANRLYESLGFELVDRNECWTKQL